MYTLAAVCDRRCSERFLIYANLRNGFGFAHDGVCFFLIMYLTLRAGGWFPYALVTIPFLIAPFFSMALCERILFCPTKNTTLSTNLNACVSINCFISQL